MAYGTPSYGYGSYTQQYQQQMAQYPQQQMQTQQPPQQLVRPVASVEEARAVQTDFTGALTIMPDTAHGAIYTKQLNLQTGCADFALYRRVQEPEISKPPETDLSGYVPRTEFDELKKRFNKLCDQLGGAGNEYAANAHAGLDGQ